MNEGNIKAQLFAWYFLYTGKYDTGMSMYGPDLYTKLRILFRKSLFASL